MNNDLQNRFIRTLVTDVIRSLERAEQTRNMSDRRDLVRTSLAAIEGLVGDYRDSIIEIAHDLGDLADEERIALSEKVVNVDRQGRISQQTRNLPMIVMFRLVTNIATKLNPAVDVDFGVLGWEHLQHAIHVRNRITHPKTTADLLVSEEDIEKTVSAVDWVMRVVIEATGAATVALKQYSDEFREVAEALKRKDPEITALYESVLRDLDD